jgi:N-acetylglucosaminyldiphosphoundecaprenol N-acetyl-beta-D-mannosaminyltransferase
MKQNVQLLNVPFTCLPLDQVILVIETSIIHAATNEYISITNTESSYYATKIAEHMHYIQNSSLSCCDGVGVVLAAKLGGLSVPRIHGPDLMAKCCEYGLSRNWRHYFYGGKEGVPELLSLHLSKRFPGMITAGTYSPPFRALTREEDQVIIENINNAHPDIVWIGLGLLKQEKWIAAHLNYIKSPWMVGVGAAFDFHAGTIKRAPGIFRRVGLEWLYRLAFEPRMFIRNVRSFFFVLKAAKESIGKNTLLKRPNHD